MSAVVPFRASGTGTGTGDEPIERIVVFRALMLGDLLCAVPALRALRQGFPGAHIAWIGLETTRAMARRLPHLIDEFIAFPGHPGLPETEPDEAGFRAFMQSVRQRRYDLALQLHGSGRIVNALVAGFDAHRSAGFFDADAPVPRADAARFTPWPTAGHEIERMLALTDHLGLPRRGLTLEFPVHAADRTELMAAWPAWVFVRGDSAAARPAIPDGLDDAAGDGEARGYVVVHPGSQLASRRWPVERFAEVADAVVAGGRQVVVTGTAAEAPLAAELIGRMRRPALDLSGRTGLGALGALIRSADALVCNDTSVSHVAAALSTPSVVVSCGADTARWAPLDRGLHRVVWADVPCRPCGHAVCPLVEPVAHPCATAITADAVIAELAQLLARGSASRPERAEARRTPVRLRTQQVSDRTPDHETVP